MKLEFKVQNVKCQGCVGAIRDGLGRHAQISAVQVDIPSGLGEAIDDVVPEGS